MRILLAEDEQDLNRIITQKLTADGYAVLASLRNAQRTTPVLFLTARDSISDRVKGLAMAEEIAVFHEGEIFVESTPGVGSTFFVHLNGF